MRPVISPEYAALNRQLHENAPDYGAQGAAGAAQIVKLCRDNGLKSVLDYGCGKGTLKPAIASLDWSLKVIEFDPAIPGKDKLPANGSVDLIAALDVMEHVEPEYLSNVLQVIKKLRPKAVFFAISTTPAKKTLPDGRNAHLLVHPGSWWETNLGAYFSKIYANEVPGSFMYLGKPR